ncbi:MAG: hypothetical protein ACXVA9_10725 [Bdellovibrionales bacterium]
MDTSNKDEKPKIVASIDVNVHWPKIEKRAWLEESIQDHLQCVLCGTDLMFKHKTDFVTQIVNEDAHCPHCNIRNRQSTHSLQ